MPSVKCLPTGSVLHIAKTWQRNQFWIHSVKGLAFCVPLPVSVKVFKGLQKSLLELCLALCYLVNVNFLVFWGVLQEVAKE